MNRWIGAPLVTSILVLSLSHPAHGTSLWTSGGPGSFVVLAMVADPVMPTTVYAGTGRGVSKSTDAGVRGPR